MNTSEMYSEKSEAYYGLVRHDVLALIPAGTKRILDVGCGNGDTGFAAKHLHGAQEVVGIEFFDSAANVAKGKLDKVVTGDIEHLDLDFPESYFDCIICADVLEHTRDPWEVLKKLRRYLDDHGVLIASIPNIRHIVPILKILFDRFEYEKSGILDKTHLRFFTLHTIRALFDETGFEISQVRSKRSTSWKFMLLNVCSLGFMRQFSIYQHIIVAGKK